MPGSLGEKIGEGVSADVHAWAPGQVVKLYKEGARRRTAVHEARMTRAAFEAGLPAPEVFDEVVLEGRFGIVMSRFDGPTLMHLSRTRAMTSPEVGAVVAALALSVHQTAPPPEVLSLRDYMDHSIRISGERLPQHIGAGILPLIERLPPGDGFCHADLHASNVIMTEDGPRLIDWTGAVRAPGAYDLAVCHILLSELAPEIVPDPERPRAVNAAMQAEYARRAGLSHAALLTAIDPYLPVVCVHALLSGAWLAQRERLIQLAEAGLIQGT